MRVSPEVSKAIGRLAMNPDFQVIAKWISDERDVAINSLMTSSQTSTVHQLQGEARTLADITRTFESAQATLPR